MILETKYTILFTGLKSLWYLNATATFKELLSIILMGVMKLSITKKDGRVYAELPPEFANELEVEVFQLRDGYYLLSLPLDKKQKPTERVQKAEQAVLDQSEKKLLEKLISIRFDQRTPGQLDRLLTTDEKKYLKSLVDCGKVNVFRSNKYPTGVYNISDRIYPLLRPASSQKPQQEQKSITVRQDGVGDLFFIQLKKDGFAVLPDYARTSEILKKQVRVGEVIGVRSFDGKTYAVTREYFSRLANIITSLLKKESGVDEIAKLCKTPSDGCRAVLAIMAERGEVLERKKNVFDLV